MFCAREYHIGSLALVFVVGSVVLFTSGSPPRRPPPCAGNAARSVAPGRSNTCTPSVTKRHLPVINCQLSKSSLIRYLTMFSTSCGLCLRTVLTAWNTSTSPCWITCSMHALAAQYTPPREWPSLQQKTGLYTRQALLKRAYCETTTTGP